MTNLILFTTASCVTATFKSLSLTQPLTAWHGSVVCNHAKAVDIFPFKRIVSYRLSVTRGTDDGYIRTATHTQKLMSDNTYPLWRDEYIIMVYPYKFICGGVFAGLLLVTVGVYMVVLYWCKSGKVHSARQSPTQSSGCVDLIPACGAWRCCHYTSPPFPSLPFLPLPL